MGWWPCDGCDSSGITCLNHCTGNLGPNSYQVVLSGFTGSCGTSPYCSNINGTYTVPNLSSCVYRECFSIYAGDSSCQCGFNLQNLTHLSVGVTITATGFTVGVAESFGPAAQPQTCLGCNWSTAFANTAQGPAPWDCRGATGVVCTYVSTTGSGSCSGTSATATVTAL